MAGYPRGTKVLFSLFGKDHTGVIESPKWTNGRTAYHVTADGPKPGPWFLWPEDLTPIPDDAPIFTRDADVTINADAPHYAGRTGYVDSPAIRDGMFGYWLVLDQPKEMVWAPAQAVAPAGGAS